MGTPAYMPPEQALGHVDELDERSDVFSLGAILCEILTKKPPYTGDDLLAKAAEARLEDAQARLDACDEREMAELARRCLSPLRADRPREAGEVAGGVRRHLAAVEERAHAAAVAAAEAEEAAERARAEALEQRRARRQAVIVAAAVLLLLIVGAGGIFAAAADRRERGRRAADAVNAALLDAQRLRGEGSWAAATSAAEKAAALARAGDAPSALRDRAAAMLATIKEEAHRASEAAAQRAREEAFVHDLDEFLFASFESFTFEVSGFVAAFASRGIDLWTPEAAIARTRADWGGIRVQLAAALDNVRFHSAPAAPWAKPFETIAKGIDPDPWRDRVRDALAAPDATTIRALRREWTERAAPTPATIQAFVDALCRNGSQDEAIGLLRDLWQQHPDNFMVHTSIAKLARRSNPTEAMRHARAAVAVRPKAAFGWHCLGHLLEGEAACDAFRTACRLAPLAAYHQACLSDACLDGGDVEGALAAAREAIHREPTFARAHYRLGEALLARGDSDGAIAACREAIRLEPEDANAHYSLGVALSRSGDSEGAIARLREVVRLDPGSARGHRMLGYVLQWSGRYAEGLESIRTGTALFEKQGTSPADSREFLEHAEYLASLAQRLPGILAGEDAPRDAKERLTFADVCVRTGHATEALKLFEESFDEDGPSWNSGTAYDAACTAALAGAKAADGSRCRGLALLWLRRWLSLHEAQSAGDPGTTARLLTWSKRDPDLTSVRDHVDALPEAERGEWRKLWADVDALLARARDGK
jgi:serine/threonine-protein kinase